MSRIPRRNNARLGAFTLLEVLCVVAISAVLMGALFGALSLTVRAITDTRATMQRTRTATGIAGILKHDLEAAYMANEKNLPAFVGGQPEGFMAVPCLQFFTTASLAPEGRRSGTGISRVEWIVAPAENAPETFDVMRREAPWTPGKGRQEAKAERLASGITYWKTAFFDGANWLDQWNRPSFPTAIRIEFSCGGGTPEKPEVLLFSPMATRGADPLPFK